MTLDLSSIASTADAQHQATEVVVGGGSLGPTMVTHDQTIQTGEARLAAELGITDWFAAGLLLPLRTYHTTIRYLDPAGDEVAIQNPFVHHHNETLTGPGDPWLYGRAATTKRSFLLGARLGVSLPLGRTEPDPFVLGDQGIPHEHSQFGTGTITPIVGIDVSRLIGPVHVDASALTVQSLYANGHGYQAGDRYGIAVGASSALGTKHWRFRATVEGVRETAERWNGIVHTDEGNIGRTDVLAGAEATWLVNDDWHIGLSIKRPIYTHVDGGQVDALGFAGLSVGTHLHVFERGHAQPHHDSVVTDWTGLDKLDIVTDGSVVPLVPVAGKITVFDFWATWCGPCGIVDQQLAEIARRHPADLAVRKINVVDVDSPASTTYLGSATLPHLKVYGRDGKLLFEKSAPPLELAGLVEAAITGATERVVEPTAPRIAIEVTDQGFVPDRIEIEHGRPVTLVFTRKSDKTCAVDVHFVLPDGGRIDQQLPLDTPVEIPIRVAEPGVVHYACGMDMNHGTITVK